MGLRNRLTQIRGWMAMQSATATQTETGRSDNPDEANEAVVTIKDAVKKFKVMRKHPIVALGLFAIEGPLRSGSWEIVCDGDDEADQARAQAYTDMLRPLWLRFFRVMLRAIGFGYQPFEIVYRFDEATGQLVIAGLKDLDPEYTEIVYADDGSFAGLKNHPPGQEHPTPLGSLSSFVMTNSRVYGNLYGEPRLETIADTYDRLVVSDKRDDKVEQEGAKRALECRAPPGETEHPKTRVKTSNAKIILETARFAENGGSYYVSSERDKDGEFKWTIEPRWNADDNADKRQVRLDAQELRLLRGLLVPDRVITQQDVGAFSLVNKVWDIFLTGEELILREIEEHVDRYILARLDTLNHPEPVTPCHLKFSPLRDDRVEMSKQLITSAFAAPDAKGLAMLARIADVSAMFDATKTPKGDKFDETLEMLSDIDIAPSGILSDIGIGDL